MKIQNLKFKIQNFKSKFKTFNFLIAFFTFNFLLLTFPIPAYAKVEIDKIFGFGDIKSLGDATSKLVAPGFSLAAVAVVIYFLLGAFKFLTSGGNKEEVAAARAMITHAIIGFIILIFAFLILQFLLSSLFKITDLQLIKT